MHDILFCTNVILKSTSRIAARLQEKWQMEFSVEMCERMHLESENDVQKCSINEKDIGVDVCRSLLSR